MALSAILVVVILLYLQFLVYTRFRRWITDHAPGRRWLLRSVSALFVILNAALILVAILRPSVRSFPEWSVFIAVYPFFVWHAATFFLAMVIVIGLLVKLPFKALRRALLHFEITRKPVRAAQNNPRIQKLDRTRRQFLK